MTEAAVPVYRCRLTGKRCEQKAGEVMACLNHKKPEKDGQLVKSQILSRS